MKKIIIFAAALAAMTACNKSVLETATPSEGFGYINLGISADAEMVVTKAATTPSDINTYNVRLLNSNSTAVWTSENGADSNGWIEYSVANTNSTLWKVAAGTYTVEVENLTTTEAYDNSSDDNANGKLRLAGSSSVTVLAGQEAPCTVICKAANSKVTFTTNANFTNVFNTTSLTVTKDGRTVNYASLGTEHNQATPAFFEKGDVTWTLSTKVGETNKTYSKSLTLTAGQWSKVTFSSSTTDGKITLTITVDDTMTTVEVPESIDPLKQTTPSAE